MEETKNTSEENITALEAYWKQQGLHESWNILKDVLTRLLKCNTTDAHKTIDLSAEETNMLQGSGVGTITTQILKEIGIKFDELNLDHTKNQLTLTKYTYA